MEMDLIYHRAHYFASTFKENFDDLVQEGVVASLEAELDFDPDKGTKFSTWLWWAIERRMRVFCERSKRVLIVEELPDLPGCDILEFIEFIDSCPADVQCVCATVLSDPNKYAGMHRWECQRELKSALREERGWTVDRAHEAIQDTKYYFTNCEPALERTR